MTIDIQVVRGDITKMEVDVIVNAANTSLLGGGGVDGAIHRAGGPAILEDCKNIRARQGGCKTGEAVITTGGKLPCKFVIHTVGPVWNGGGNGEEELLENAYRNSLKLAVENDVGSIAFPNISTGIYGFPKEKAARIAVAVVKEFLTGVSMKEIRAGAQMLVVFVCYDEENHTIYKSELDAAAGGQ